jgi:CBS domain-containing protein/sporulation protein YlmC with PRC-barrel domain
MAMWLSRILDQPVFDAQGERLGRCVDILVAETEKALPPLRAVAVAEDRGRVRIIPAEEIAWLSPSMILKGRQPPEYTPRGDELYLRRQVLDRQIVDTEGRRLVRVNDLQITKPNGRYCLAGVDVSSMGLARRLGAENLVEQVATVLRRDVPRIVIPWRDVAPIESDAPIRLRVSRDRLSRMHPADIANIVAELDPSTGQALLTSLETSMVADAMQEIDPALQVSMIETLGPDRAADVVEQMDPDDAADLLADLEPDDRARILELMQDDNAVDVEKLLAYPPASAGGIMTTEFTTLPRGLTAAEAMAALRRSAEAREDETMYYVYVVDDERHLEGVLTLRDLVMAAPESRIDQLLGSRPLSVNVLTPQEEVSRLVAKYDLLAVPVVDESNVLHGIVTVDDAIDAIIPTAWKKRLPRFF